MLPTEVSISSAEVAAGERVGTVAEELSKIGTNITTAGERIGEVRKGIAGEGGPSSIDSEVRIRSASEAFRYLPRASLVVLFAPVPFESRPDGETGSFRDFASLEMVALYCLYPALLVSLRRIWSSGDPRLWLLLASITFPAAALAVAVPNVGTLFRLRGQLVIPLIVLVAAAGGFTLYRRLRLLAREGRPARQMSHPAA